MTKSKENTGTLGFNIVKTWEKELNYLLSVLKEYEDIDRHNFTRDMQDVWDYKVKRLKERILKHEELVNYLRGIKDGPI